MPCVLPVVGGLIHLALCPRQTQSCQTNMGLVQPFSVDALLRRDQRLVGCAQSYVAICAQPLGAQ